MFMSGIFFLYVKAKKLEGDMSRNENLISCYSVTVTITTSTRKLVKQVDDFFKKRKLFLHEIHFHGLLFILYAGG